MAQGFGPINHSASSTTACLKEWDINRIISISPAMWPIEAFVRGSYKFGVSPRAFPRAGIHVCPAETSLQSMGEDADAVLAKTQDQAVKDKLRAATDEASERGAFGAPTFFIEDEMFWGNDRFEFIEQRLRTA